MEFKRIVAAKPCLATLPPVFDCEGSMAFSEKHYCRIVWKVRLGTEGLSANTRITFYLFLLAVTHFWNRKRLPFFQMCEENYIITGKYICNIFFPNYLLGYSLYAYGTMKK